MSDIDFVREIRFYPAFDKRSPDPNKNYGIHGVELAFFLKGPHGAVQFKVSTNWQLPHVQAEIDGKVPNSQFPYMFHEPMAVDLGYHSKNPMRDGQEPMSGNCDVIGGTCYYDGSVLEANRIFNTLREEGDKGVWRELEIYYRAVFFYGARNDTFRELIDKMKQLISKK